MPVYSLTSPETGRSYQVNIDGEPDSEDMDAIWPQLDAHAAQREADKPFFALGDTLSGIGTALGGIPETATESFYRLTEGMKRPDQYSPAARAAFDEKKKFTEQVQKESQDRLMRGEASSTGESFRDAAPSLGFSFVTMGANILGRVVGRPLGAVAGGLVSAPTGPGAVGGAGLGATIGSTAGGMAASGYAAYRMAGNQFLDSAFNRIGEERAKRGEPWGENEKAQAYNELLPLAQDTGLWEAGPEAVGNAVGFGAGKYVLGLGKKTVTELADSIWKKTLKKGAAALGGMGTEVGTETITQVGSAPAQAQAQALAQGNPNWRQEPGPYAGPGGTLQAMADVAPATLAQSALMLGAGGAVKAGQALIPGATPQAPSLSAVQPERPEGRTTNSASSISPLPGIAQRAGTVDVPPLVPGLEVEDLGPLTAGDVADLNPAPAPTPRQPILGNVPDAVQGVGQPMSDAFSQQPQGGQSAQPGSASVTLAGSSPAAAANTGQTMPAERVVSTGKPNGAQVTAVIDFVEAEDLEPLLLREVGSDQTRDRANNRGSAEQIASIATSPDAQLLGDSPVSSMGAPVVDDVILAGNGRAEGLLQGYRGGGEGISNYRAQVVQQAAAQGRADVAGMKQPVMIRRVTGYVRGDRRSFVTESNPKYATLQETVAEAALLDAEVLGDMAGIEFTQSGQLTSSSLQQVATKLKEAQRGVNATTGGKPDVVEGTRRVQLASLAKLAKDNGVDVAELSGLLETDVGRRAVAEVSKAAPRLAALDADLGLGDVMLSALRSFSEGARAVSQGIFKNLTEWADNRGQELIRDELSPEAGQLLEIMIETVRTPTKLRELFDTYLEAATNEQTQRNQAAGSDDIFGETRSGVQGRELIRRQMAGTTDTAPATAQSSGGQGNAAVITPTRPTATAAATPPAAAPAAMPVRGEVGSGGAGGAALLDVAPSTRPRNRGETAKPQRDDVLAELGQATREGAANQAQGQFEAIEAARKAASDRIMAQLQSGGIEVSAAELTASTQRGFKTFSVDGSTAGFANFQILNEGFDLVQRGFNTFAAWSQAMLARFGQGIREFLAVIWSQVTGQERQEIIGGQTNAVRNVRMGMPQGNAPVGMGQAGFIPNPNQGQPVTNESQSRFASPEAAQRTINGPRADVQVAAEAVAWLDSMPAAEAVAAFEGQAVPLPLDAAEHAAAVLISRLTQQGEIGQTETAKLTAHVQAQRMARVWTREFLSADPARALRQRGVVNNTILRPIAPVMAAQGILVDRADAVMDKRFAGGAGGAVEKITSILNDVQGDITERVEAILNAVLGARLKPRVSIREAVAGLVNGKTQRDEMIEDVARALMQKAKSSQVKPEQKTALAALVASLKRTLGAAVKGKALKPDALSFGELLARTFVDQVAEAPLFEESWAAGREQVRQMLIELGMSEADAMKRLNELMPATPTVAYAPGMVKQAVQRGFEAAGYGQTLATGADKSGQRELDVRAEVLRNPQKAMEAVMRVWDEEAQNGSISPEAWAQGRQLAFRALNETVQQWRQQAAEAATKAAEATKNRLLAKDSPALAKLLKELAAKIAPGMNWADIFMDMPSTQRERQREIYRRLMLDERLKGLSAEERLDLTNELDRAWQRERRKVFLRELEKAGVLGEKDKGDREKVKKALPKLLRMINLGLFSSEMWREAVAPEYGLRMLTAADTAQLRALADAAWKLPEGVIRNQKLRNLLNAIQKKTGSSWIEVLNSYWTAAVLSGLRTQFDTWMAAVNGMGTNLMQIGGLIARGQGRAAIDAHAQWWRGLFEGVRESGQILFKGDTSYLKRFGADLKKALEGETSVTPVPLGENLWRNGNTFQKYGLAPVMMFTGRLMAAADHVNNTATTQGAIAVARALHPELYAGKVGFTETERADARAQALREVTGGREPMTSEERATVSARTREVLNGTVKPEDYAAASEIGDMAAYQNDPTGVFGIVYSAMKQGLGSIQRGLGNYAEDVTANRYARIAAGIMAGSLHGITGTRFMRFGANFGADLTRYIPGSYVLGKAGFYGREVSRMQQELLLGKNLVGLMLASTLAAIFLNSDDEDEGWQIEGDWSTLNPQQAKERMAAGLERLTMWKRDGDQVRRVSYKQWPTMGLFAVVGGMLDEKRHKPANWSQHGTAGHLLRGVATGYTQVKNVSAVRNLVELFGEPTFAADAVDGTIEKMIKTGSNFAGGFMPTLLKDADIWTDPRSFKPEGVAEMMARNTPILRKFVNDGRPQLNLLGEEVKLQRAPWSRAYTSVESGEAHRVLGALLARGLSLPMPSDQISVIKDGVKVPLESLGREAVWKYERAVGQGYKAWLNLEGSDLLKLMTKQADAVIKRRAEVIKARAKGQVMR